MTEEIKQDLNDTETADFIGQIVIGRCQDVGEKRVIFSFNEGQHIFVNRAECPRNIRLNDALEIYVDGISKNGIWSGSIEKIAAAKLYETIEKARKDETDLEATVIAAENNGLVCDLQSLYAFMPRREIEESPMQELAGYLGKRYKVRVLKFAPNDGKIIISHKAAIALELREARENLLAQLKPEQRYIGIVKQIVDFGVFVDIGAGVEGLIHRSNLSWDNEDPASFTAIGEKLQVVVLSTEKGRISLGHKQLIEDTWAEMVKDLHVDDIVNARITTFTNFGAFAKVEDKIEGLIHNSELSWDNGIKQPRQILNLNDVVKVRILAIEEDRRRLKLSLKRTTENPWKVAAEKYTVGSTWTLKIAGIADFGLFVSLGDNIRGLIHKSDIQWTGNVNDLAERYHIGDDVECKVLDFDVEKERASFGIKQLTRDPWTEFLAQKPLGRAFEAEIRRITKFGAFAAIGDVDGLIHISEMSENRVENIDAILKVGQTVTVTVINIDENRRRIGLSMIAEPFEPENSESDSSLNADNDGKATLADIMPENIRNSSGKDEG